MDLLEKEMNDVSNSFPHTRGDGPWAILRGWFLFRFSPHTWGWTYPVYHINAGYDVFPTHVGMDLEPIGYIASKVSFPHTRGDGPEAETIS